MTESEILEKLKRIREYVEWQRGEIARLQAIIADDSGKATDRDDYSNEPEKIPLPTSALLASRTIVRPEKSLYEEPKVRNYTFARATKETAQKLEKFIRKCVPTEAGKAFLVQPETAAIYADISVKTKDTFMGILMGMSMKGKKLVVKADDRYFSNYTADQICSYLLQEI